MNYQLYFLLAIGILVTTSMAANDDDAKIVNNDELANKNEITDADELANTNESYEEWEKLQNYQGSPTERRPTVYTFSDKLRTHELLSLARFYSGRHDADFIGQREQVKYLLESFKITDDKCDEDSFKKLNVMTKYNSRYTVNTVPYLENCRKEQFEHCKPIFVSKLKKVVDEFSDDEKAGVLALRNDGVLHYMLSRANSSMDRIVKSETKGKSVQDFKIFKEEFRRIVARLCINIVGKLNPLWKIYIQLKDSNLLSRMDEFTLEWIKNADVCGEILVHFDYVVEETYDKFKIHTGKNSGTNSDKKGWKYSFLKCFTGH